MRAHQAEQLADKSLRCPGGQPDASARAYHPQQFVRGSVVVGRKHHTEGGQGDIEAAVGKRQRLGVGDAELHREPIGLCPRGGLVEKVRDIVGRGHRGEAPRRGQSGIAIARGHVEHPLAGAQVRGLGQGFPHDLQRDADDGVIAARPGGLLALLDCLEVGRRRDG